MEENDVSVGDVVELKSGGPSMTVLWLNDSKMLSMTDSRMFRCAWFNKAIGDSRELREGSFPSYALNKIATL